MHKVFKVNGTTFHADVWAYKAAFGYAIDCGDRSMGEVKEQFDALEIGETLVDEDGDTWERIA